MRFLERPEQGTYLNNKKFRLFGRGLEGKVKYQFAADQISHIPTVDVIGDFGCGNGESTEFLQKYLQSNFNLNPFMLAADISGNDIKVAAQRRMKNVRFFTQDLSEPIDLQPNTHLDGAVFIEVVEHIKPPDLAKKAITHIAEVLDPNHGIMIVSSPNRTCLSKDRYRSYNQFHAQEFNQQEFSEILTEAGLKIEQTFGQIQIPNSVNQTLDIVRMLANKIPSKRQQFGLLMSLLIRLVQPSYDILPLKDGYQPKYFVAVCTKK